MLLSLILFCINVLLGLTAIIVGVLGIRVSIWLFQEGLVGILLGTSFIMMSIIMILAGALILCIIF